MSEAWSGVNWADVMAARAPLGPIFMTGLYSVQSIVPTIVLVDHVIKIGPKDALGSHEIRPIHSAPSLGRSICRYVRYVPE